MFSVFETSILVAINILTEARAIFNHYKRWTWLFDCSSLYAGFSWPFCNTVFCENQRSSKQTLPGCYCSFYICLQPNWYSWATNFCGHLCGSIICISFHPIGLLMLHLSLPCRSYIFNLPISEMGLSSG